ncbi:hypothetical protein L6R52_25810 [Myxococcota bacterium]|nr:hypothetical protein [Myxococcota bacterium]
MSVVLINMVGTATNVIVFPDDWTSTSPSYVPTCWAADDRRDRHRWEPPTLVMERLSRAPRARTVTRSIGGGYQRPRTDDEFRADVERLAALHWYRALSRELSRDPRPVRIRSGSPVVRSRTGPFRHRAYRREPGRPSRSRCRRPEAAR